MNRVTPKLLESVRHQSVDGKAAPSLERRRLRAYAMMLVADGAIFNLSFALAALLWEGRWWEPRTMLAAQAMLPVYFTIALYNRSYGVRALGDWLFAARQAVIAVMISAALINFVGFYTKTNQDFSRASVTLGLLFTMLLLVALRRVVESLIRQHWGGRVTNRLVIDDGGSSFTFDGAEHISAAEYNLDPASHDPFMLDRLGKLLRNQDQIVVSCPRDRRARILKRAFDVAVAGSALLVLSPLLIAVAIAIKLEDRGPVLFVQRRLGRGNQFFDMFKFRSMQGDKLDPNGNRSAARDDDRITRVGAFIRRTSIDELPQIINVLKGNMSIVGPRPHALGSTANNKYFWEVDRQYWQRHCLKPGLTGLAQVRGHRGATAVEKDLTDRLQSDLEYIAGWSLRRDIEIVLRTVMVLRHDNAY